MIDEIKNITRTVYLTDKVTDQKYDLTNPITLNLTSGTYDDRFYISFSSIVLNTEDEILKETLNVYFNSSAQEITIEKLGTIDIKNVELYNLLGQNVQSWKSVDNTSNKVKLKTSSISEGIYIVRVNTEKGKLSKKIVFSK